MTNGGDVENPGQGYSARLLYKKPAETLKWLEQCGVKKLGDFMVRVGAVHIPQDAVTSQPAYWQGVLQSEEGISNGHYSDLCGAKIMRCNPQRHASSSWPWKLGMCRTTRCCSCWTGTAC